MCGITGVISQSPIVDDAIFAIKQQSGRGQDATGLIISDHDKYYCERVSGTPGYLINTLKDNPIIKRGTVALGHNRYSTQGGADNKTNMQPFVSGDVAQVHNGNLKNYDLLRMRVESDYGYTCNTDSDGELLLKIVDESIRKQPNSKHIIDKVASGIQEVFDQAKGGYSVVGFIKNQGMFAYRDPHGIRPMSVGIKRKDAVESHMFVSESGLFQGLEYTQLDDVDRGQLHFIDTHGNKHKSVIQQRERAPDLFEYIYFARIDSTINGIPVGEFREVAGKLLAQSFKDKYPGVLPDVVSSIPSTADPYAMAVAKELGVPYVQGFYKQSNVGRSFIYSVDKIDRKLDEKLFVMPRDIQGKNVMFVDDSIVRGKTSEKIMKKVRQHASVKEIYFLSACPPIRHNAHYGINLTNEQNLIAHNRTEEQVRKKLGVDYLHYQSEEDVLKALDVVSNPFNIKNFNMGYIDKRYRTDER